MLSTWGNEKVLLPSGVNNSFRGILCSLEDKIHEHIQVSLLLGRRGKGNLPVFFTHFCRFFVRGFLQKISHFDGKDWLWPSKLLNLIGHIENKLRQLSMPSVQYSKQQF